MNKKNLYRIVITVLVVMIVVGCKGLDNSGLTLQKVMEKARTIYPPQTYKDKIKSITVKSKFFNENGQLVLSKDMFLLSHSLRINAYDFRDNNNYVIIGSWSNRPLENISTLLFYDILFLHTANYILINTLPDPMISILKGQCGLKKVGKKEYFVVTFLYYKDNVIRKVKGYLEYDTFIWRKMETFIFRNNKWAETAEIYVEKVSNVGGIMAPSEATIYFYSFEGKKKFKVKTVYEGLNKDIDNNIFEIPKGN